MKKGIYYIWIGAILILIGAYYQSLTSGELTLSIEVVIVGIIIWIYGVIKSLNKIHSRRY